VGLVFDVEVSVGSGESKNQIESKMLVGLQLLKP
jgi:hypothetical protein